MTKEQKTRFWNNTLVYTLLLLGYLLIYAMGIFKSDEASTSKVDFIYQQF